jgi:hypothetical protein
VLFGRFICSTILHLAVVDDVTIGLEMMKFACNHDYKFSNYFIAWGSGFLQVTATLSIEIVSIGVICSAIDPISIIQNFISLAILVEFDIYVYESIKNESFKELVEKEFVLKVCKIKHTTSKKCQPWELSDEFDEETGRLRPLKVRFAVRTLFNKLLYIFYKLLRMMYVSQVFYFLPFLTIIISTLIPIIYRHKRPVPPFAADSYLDSDFVEGESYFAQFFPGFAE